MIDTHCHLDFYPSPELIAQEAGDNGVTVISVSNLPSHFAQSLPHIVRYKWIRPALGLHPLIAESHTIQEQRLFLNLLEKTSYIGEVGLDYSAAGKTTFQEQLKTFRFVLASITDHPKIMTLHSRGAESIILDLLQEYLVTPVMFHWYTGSFTVLEKILDAGHYFSINTAMMTTAKGRGIISRIPPTKMLTETDGPYTKINQKTTHPKDVSLVLSFLASEWNVPLDMATKQIHDNFLGLVKGLKL